MRKLSSKLIKDILIGGINNFIMILNGIRRVLHPNLNRGISLVNNKKLLLGSDTVLGQNLIPELKIRYDLANFYSLGRNITENKQERHFKLTLFSQVSKAFEIHKPNLVLVCDPLNDPNNNNIKESISNIIELFNKVHKHKARYIYITNRIVFFSGIYEDLQTKFEVEFIVIVEIV